MVKQASGVVITAPQVTGDRKVARRVRVYCTVIDAIRSGVLRPGTRLPSARQLAAEGGHARPPLRKERQPSLNLGHRSLLYGIGALTASRGCCS